MEKKKKKGAKGVAVAGGLVLLTLLGGVIGFGVGSGDGFGIFSKAEPAMTQTDADQTEATEAPATAEPVADAETQEAGQRQIRIKESTVSFAGETVTLDVLREKLLSDYDETAPWELIDDHAIKADYDAVKAMLDELSMAYIEK